MEDLSKLIVHTKGTMPLILSVPHGGEFLCDEIPTRLVGICGIDKNTINLAQELVEKIFNVYYKRKEQTQKPSLIFCNVARNKIDLNRPIETAFNNSSKFAKSIYQKYHDTLKKYVIQNIETHGTSLLLDIHGFEAKSRPPGFRDVDLILGTDNLKSLCNTPIKKNEWSNNIRGNIINTFLDLEISIAPGHPGRKEYVLSGGYITQKYGASQIFNSQALQIEFSDRIRVHDEQLKKKVLNSLAEIIFDHFN